MSEESQVWDSEFMQEVREKKEIRQKDENLQEQKNV